MKYDVILKPSAEKQLRRLSKSLQHRIIDKLADLEVDPRVTGATKLSGSERTWRARIGNYRVVYEIRDSEKVIFVTVIAHRREVYRGL